MKTLVGTRVLVVEDLALVALELEVTLMAAGVRSVDIAPNLASAMTMLDASEPAFDLALLDINLHGQHSYPAIDLCRARQIPLLLVTGYDVSMLLEPYQRLPCVQKPCETSRLLQAATCALACKTPCRA